jgi:hypothetical protein
MSDNNEFNRGQNEALRQIGRLLGLTICTHQSVAKEIERLRAIVEQLDKTEDGVPITPGMKLYRFGISNYGRVYESHGQACTGVENDDYYSPHAYSGGMWSTEEEAREALK